ncbi:YybH family protein [Profundibacter sp.]|uniref:YybH family protein n=1 Tax=Profundibacter sp. TaxID=3101071 RepID=UPI003D128977
MKQIIFTAILGFCGLTATISDAGNFKITDPNQGHQIFTDALNAKDLDILVDIYADDAVMVAPGNNVIRGKENIRAFFVETLKVVESITLDTVFRVNYKDTVVFRSNYTVVYKTEDGQTVTQAASGIEVERLQPDGTWLFIVDHHYGGTDLVKFMQMNQPQ